MFGRATRHGMISEGPEDTSSEWNGIRIVAATHQCVADVAQHNLDPIPVPALIFVQTQNQTRIQRNKLQTAGPFCISEDKPFAIRSGASPASSG
jgi:hypothetical protein